MTNKEMENALKGIMEWGKPYAEKLYKLGYYNKKFGNIPTLNKWGKSCLVSLSTANNSSSGMEIRLSNQSWGHDDVYLLDNGELKNFRDKFEIQDYNRKSFIPLLTYWKSIKEEVVDFVHKKEEENKALDSFEL